MVTNKEYELKRNALLQEQAPFVVLNKNELFAERENFYNAAYQSWLRHTYKTGLTS